jgi:hypothetical protein
MLKFIILELGFHAKVHYTKAWISCCNSLFYSWDFMLEFIIIELGFHV